MKITETTFAELSNLEFKIAHCDSEDDSEITTLVLTFSGKYGHGSAGNGDGRFMLGMVTAAFSLWRMACDCLVIDLRQLEYEWGNTIWGVFLEIKRQYSPELTAVVISDLNRKALAGCPALPQPFTELEDAIHHVQKQAQEISDNSTNHAPSNTKSLRLASRLLCWIGGALMIVGLLMAFLYQMNGEGSQQTPAEEYWLSGITILSLFGGGGMICAGTIGTYLSQQKRK